MENPIWNVITKAFSLIGIILLGSGTALLFAAYFGFREDNFAGLITILSGSTVSIIALAAVNLSEFRLRLEMKQAADAAHRLSQGELYEGNASGELLDSLKDISGYLKQKAAVAAKIAGGDLPEDVLPHSDSDVLGKAFQTMVANLRLLVQTKETRDRLHNSVMKLLDEVSEVSAGDLTVQAEVGPEITGAIANAFNSMTINLRVLISQVKDITLRIATSASSINDTTEQLASGSVAQASQISRTTAAVSNMAVQIQEVSENAALSAKVAAESLINARSGTKAARDNINAMQTVRKQVQETAKRIKKLGERSQEIGQIVTLIEDLSDRTSLLALNASLQASGAGESGAGFAIVAEEVERLAERSNRLTHQISALTQSINVETKEVVASMEETIREVIVGSTLADKAGHSLVEIEQVSTKLAELLRSISESAQYQAKSSEDISNAMSGISEVTELVQSGSKRAAESVRMLVMLSGDLRSSVSPFKLPAEIHPGKPAAADTGLFIN